MNSTISTFTHREPKAWKAPAFESPLLINARDLKPLGEVRGYHWWTHPKHDGELAERPKRLTDRDVLPNRMLAQVDEKGERSYRVFDIYAPGTFATSADTFGKPAPAPLRFVDALPAIYAPRPRVKLSPRQGGSSLVVMDATTTPLVHAPKVRVYGPVPILADLARRGVVVTLGTDRASLPVQARSTLMGNDLQTLRDASPLLLAHLRGDPPPECTSGPHAKGQDAPAVSVGPLGSLICAAHLAERA
jgi:hypothetical protein